jgi:ATP-dependent DNA ligase
VWPGSLYAFDLIELDGNDLRRDPLAVRKATRSAVTSTIDRLASEFF